MGEGGCSGGCGGGGMPWQSLTSSYVIWQVPIACRTEMLSTALISPLTTTCKPVAPGGTLCTSEPPPPLKPIAIASLHVDVTVAKKVA